jgi:hypoxanthine phosphoribosyltransferase
LLNAKGCARVRFALSAMAKTAGPKPKSKGKTGESVRTLISRAEIQRRVTEMAGEIRRDFPVEPLHMVAVLKGSVFFLTDLARQMGGDVSMDFIAVSSYGGGTHTSGQVKLTRDLDSSIEGKTVIVVEDILDTGMTLQYLLRIFEQRKPRRLRVAVLLDKPERRIAKVRADYVGFKIPNEFVVGYGLDYAERYRNLPDIGVLTLGAKEKKL